MKTKVYDWTPLLGCRPVSKGCRNCTALAQMLRNARKNHGRGKPFIHVVNPDTDKWNGESLEAPKRLEGPTTVKAPRIYEVCKNGDLFYPGHSYEDIAKVFLVMQRCPQHTFLITTKYIENALAWADKIGNTFANHNFAEAPATDYPAFKNVWMGVSAELQVNADARVPLLLQFPARNHWVDCKPLLNLVTLAPWIKDLDMVRVGGEIGRKARILGKVWVERLLRECTRANTHFWFEQWGRYDHAGMPGNYKKNGNTLNGKQYIPKFLQR